MDLYAANIMDHYRRPRNRGRIEQPQGEAQLRNVNCGDELCVTVALHAGRLAALKFTGSGCAISQAAISILSTALIDKPVAEIAALSFSDLQALLGIPISARRRACALIGLQAVQQALKSAKAH